MMSNGLDPVRLPSEIRDNLRLFETYRCSNEPRERDFWRKRVHLGVDFIVYRRNGTPSFAPSRFIGYAGNSMEAHFSNRSKDGGVTNRKIGETMGRDFIPDEGFETEYQRVCAENNIRPTAKHRRYLDSGLDLRSLDPSDSKAAEDMTQILNDPHLTATEKQSLASARIGQGTFRRSLLDYWGACAVTGSKQHALLRASHIRPWSDSDNSQRLDPFNGILLVPNLDAAFDEGLITFDKAGWVRLSRLFSEHDARLLGIHPAMRAALTPRHQSYLQYHREHVFQG